MAEKLVEVALSECLKDFNQSNIFFSPSENSTLKKMFMKASKTGDGAGFPDRLYYDEKILIVFECKQKKINIAKKDLMTYKSKMVLPDVNLQIYYVAFTKNTYEVYDSEFRKIDITINPVNFGIFQNEQKSYTLQNMTKDIHELHNYIRDYTKISNEDKSYFVACILISFKKDSFYTMINNFNSKLYIYDVIKQNLTDFGIDITIFEFLRNDENNTHFLHIIKMIKKIYDASPSVDLLNLFYNEFVKYGNTDGKSLGIVLTPEHIVKIMIKMLDIKPYDTFLDLCAGTGSFILEALNYKPEHIIACEYQTKLYGLLKCNMILRNVSDEKSDIIQGDCFEYNFKANKSAINPPYGMKDKRELDFILKQIDSVEEEGLICAIIPCSCLAKSIDRNILFKKTIIIKIVICNNDLFYPNAGVKTCIILAKKKTHKLIKQSIIIDNFENDGFEIQRTKGRVYTSNGFHDIMETVIKESDETWMRFKIEHKLEKKDLVLKMMEIEYNTRRLEYLSSITGGVESSIMTPPPVIKSFKISDLFYILKKPRNKYDISKSNLVYEISAKNNNNGIKDVVPCNEYTFTGGKIVLVTGGNGGAGIAYYQETDFNISSATIVLEPKDNLLMNMETGIYIAAELSKYKFKYSRGFTWNISRINEDTLELPVLKDVEDIDYDYIFKLYHR